MTTIGERIRIARLARGLSVAELSRLLDKSPTASSISQWEGKHTEPSLENTARVAQALKVDGGWLLTGTGKSGLHGDDGPTEIGTWVPLLTEPQILSEQSQETAPLFRAATPVGNRAWAHRIQTRAMEGIVRAGDYVVCDPDARADPNDLVVAKTDGGLAWGRLRLVREKSRVTAFVQPIASGWPEEPAPEGALAVIVEVICRITPLT